MGTFEDFSRENRKRCEAPNGFNHPLGSWSASDWMVATFGELGEASNIIKKLNRLRDGIQNKKGETADQLHAMLRDEMADAFTYLDLTAQALGFDILEAAERKFEKVSDEIGYDPIRRFAVPPKPPGKGDRYIDNQSGREMQFDGMGWIYADSLAKQIADDMAAGTATFGNSGPATLTEYEGGGGSSGGAGATGSWVDDTPSSGPASTDSGSSSSDSGSSSSSSGTD